MVGFLRKKKSDRAVLSGGTVLDRKGKVDNTSLLDMDGEPTEGSLYDKNGKRVSHTQRNSDEENRSKPVNDAGYPSVMATGAYPPQHSSYGNQQQQMGVYGHQPQQQYGQQAQQQYGQLPLQQQQYQQQQYGQMPLQQQQYGQQALPQQYGHPQQPQYTQSNGFGQQQQYPPTTLGGQYQYPVRYGQMPPPMPAAAPKRSLFRLPGKMGKKN